MASSQKPGTPGTKTGVRRWTYNAIPNGTKHKGFKAGDPFGVYVHYINRKSLPCKERITKGELVCPFCDGKYVPEWRGYTPFWSQEYAPFFCLITEEYYEATCEIEHLAPVTISRGPLNTDPAIMRYDAWRATPIPHNAMRAKPVDLSTFLIDVIWKDEELCRWDRLDRIKAKEAEPKPYVAPEYQDKDLARMRLLMKKEEKQNAELAALGNSMAKVIQDATTPKPNGKHPKPQT
jgi:hypothetical protein